MYFPPSFVHPSLLRWRAIAANNTPTGTVTLANALIASGLASLRGYAAQNSSKPFAAPLGALGVLVNGSWLLVIGLWLGGDALTTGARFVLFALRFVSR